MSDDGIERPHGTWTDAVAPIVRKFEVAAAMNLDAVWNPVGARATGELMKEMARLLDNEAPEAIRVRDEAIEDITAKNQRLLEIGRDAAGHIRHLEAEVAELKARLTGAEEGQ